jgi:type 1 fimbria pilin
MKTGKIIGAAAIIAIMFLSLASLASAQHLLGDVWFQMKISAKGHTITPPGSTVAPYSNVSTIYVRFWPTATAYEHNWQMWAQESQTGDWAAVNGTQYIYGSADGLIWGWETEWTTSPPVGIAATITGIMKIKRDGSVTKSAKFTSTGCDIIGGQTQTRDFYGGCKVTGKTITSDKLPFTP